MSALIRLLTVRLDIQEKITVNKESEVKTEHTKIKSSAKSGEAYYLSGK